MASLARLAALATPRLYPGHGAPIDDPAARLAELAAHRRARSRQILDALAEGAQDAAALVARIYTDTPKALLPAARRNVFAHLIDLAEQRLVAADLPLAPTSRFHRV
jgi:hydroxyacylglutathione hydrolase